MLWNLGAGWLLMAVVVVAILSFIVATALNALLGREAFGATGNAVVITVGFFLGILAANNLGYRLADVKLAVAVGLGGAFVCFSLLVALKAALRRFTG